MNASAKKSVRWSLITGGIEKSKSVYTTEEVIEILSPDSDFELCDLDDIDIDKYSRFG